MSFFSVFYSFFGGNKLINTEDLSSVNDDDISDKDIENIDVSFAKKTRKVIKWFSVNGEEISSIVNSNKLGIVGTKINIQSRIKGEKDINDQIEDYISWFSEYRNCDVTGRFHFNEAIHSMVEFTDKDGGFLIKHHYNKEWEIPYRFELISVDMIDIYKDHEENNVRNGIKKDSFGRITSIYLYKDSKMVDSVEVSMDNMLYYFPVWISLSQYTAVSKLSSIISSIDKITDYTKSELQAATERAKAGSYWKTSLYDDLMKIIKSERDDKVKKQQLKETMRKLSSSAIKPYGLTAIPKDDEIVKNQNNSDSIYNSLNNTLQLKMSSSQGLSSQIVFKDPSKSNYSAIKSMLALAQINWSIEFENLKEKVLKPIMKEVIRTGVADGKIKIDDYFRNERKYLKLEFMRVSEIDIEPLKTANANAKNISNGTHSKRELVSKRGRDIEEVMREEIEDQILYEKMKEEMFKENGLKYNKEDIK